MLLLSRRRGESVVIGDNVEVTVMRVEGNQVQLGVTAPRNVPVHRREIYLAIKAENQGASRLNLQDLPVLPNRR